MSQDNQYVVVSQGQLGPLLDAPDAEVGKVAAFNGYNAHQSSRTAEFMGGLIRDGWPGTESTPVPTPITPYQPNVKATRPSYAADHINPTIGVALNLRLYRPGPSRYASARYNPPTEPGGEYEMPWEGMKAQPVYGDRVTDWPRFTPRYLTFGEGG